MTTPSKSMSAAIAVTRFGLGARPGEIEQATADAQGWLLAQIRPEGADMPVSVDPAAPWPDAANRLQALAGYRDQLKLLRVDFDQPAPAKAGLGRGAPPLIQSSQPMGGAGVMSGEPQGAQMLAPTLPAQAPAAGVDQRPEFIAARRAAKQPLDDETSAEVLARAQLACTTPAGFRERWTLFWSNHFTVASKNEEMQTLAPVFEREAIRPYVFGRFETLLTASTTHPAMLHYLDQVRSVGPDSPIGLKRRLGLNENLAREVLELHTVGADAGYTQADVTEFARALTGLTLGDGRPQSGPFGQLVFREDWHEPGPRRVMGRSYPGDGEEPARLILAALAADPRTARRLARKIAAHFVADDPPPGLCARLEHAYVRSGGDLGQVAQALIAAPEAWTPRPVKLKTPYEFVVSAWRAADAQPTDVRKEVLYPLNSLGQRPFYAPQPNGWPDEAQAWSAPDAVVKRLYLAQAFAGAHAPPGDPREVARQALGDRLTPEAALAISRAESRPEAFALLLMTPEFQRR